MKEEIKSLIKNFHRSESINLYERDFKIPLNSGKIITLIGARRVGKTYLFYQIIQNLVQTGINIENILYLNFEDERFDFSSKNLKLIIEAYGELYPNLDFSKCYFFFDEIQNVENWEKFVRRIHDNYSKNIFLTGSSAKLLSKEIATSLRGRNLSYEVYPLSFKEFLKFREVDIDLYYEKSLFLIKKNFESFLLEGSYPEIVNFDNKLKFKSYQEYLNVMIFKDIVERYNLKNRELLNIFIKKSLSNISREFSINKFYKELNSQGIKVSKDLIYEFPNYLEDIFLSFFLPKYESSILKKSFASKKIYANDVGFVNLFKFSEDKGRLLENIVFLELKRRDFEIYYFKDKFECDFVVMKANQILNLIQVSLNLKDEITKEREIKGLITAMKKTKSKNGLILTLEEDEEIEVQGMKISIKPCWRWLLENE